MLTVASKVPFHELAGLLEKISKKNGSEEKKKITRLFIDKWRGFHDKIHQNDATTKDSFYPALRLLLPQLEKERDAYGIKEHTLAKLYIDILGLGKDSLAAQKLLNYRAPKGSKADIGDFANVAYWVLKPRCPEKGTLTIEEVNTHLDGIALCNADKNKDGVRKHLLHMLRNMSAYEQKWLIRMIMKELKMGLSQQSIFSVYHQDAEDLFNVKMSLRAVCELLKDPSVRIHEIEVSLFSPFRPMLGDRGSPGKMENTMDGKTFFIETKFDGERMQLHKKKDEYKFFSRGGNDYTHIYGSHPLDGNFTPSVANCFKENIQSCILDGEMVGFDPVSKLIGTKGENFDIKSATLEGYQPMLCVFDVLMINDKVLSNRPLRERKKFLKDVFEPVEGHMICSEHKEARTNQECVDALNEAIDRREEGIMVKDPDSPYKPNTRKGGWYKIKPEYVGGLMDELDVVVVGGNFGTGHRSDMMSHFLCAVAVPAAKGERPSKFQTFCRVGSGYSKKELYDFNKKLHAHWNVFDRRKPPEFLEMPPGFRQRPDAWIHPSKSCILQIKAAEITVSDQFKTGCTLRFPRVEKIRHDKHWYECMTTDDIVDLRQKSGGKLAGRYAEITGEEEEEPKKKRRKVVTKHIRPTVAARFRGVDSSSVKQVSKMFEGKEVCVINGPASHPKSDLEKKILEFGGTIVQNPGDDTFCVLADKVAIKVKNIISKGNYNVVKVHWLLRCLDQERFIPWVPADMIYSSPKTLDLFALSYDQHGDSYYEDTSVPELRNVFQKIQAEGSAKSLSAEDIAEMEMKYFPQDSPLGLFRLAKVYLDSNLVVDDPSTHIEGCSMELVGLELRFYGATLESHVEPMASHVVVDNRDTSRLSTFRQMNRDRLKKFHIVTKDWVYDSIQQEKLLKERDYEPVT